MRGATAGHGPIPWAAGEGPMRCRVGIARLPWWSCKWIALLLPALIVLPWLPISKPRSDAARSRGARGVGNTAILAFAFAPDGKTIATIQVDARVALRDATDNRNVAGFLDHRGQATALAFSPDGRSLTVGGTEPDILLYDAGGSGAGRRLGMPIREPRALAFSPDGRILAASSYLHDGILLWDLV